HFLTVAGLFIRLLTERSTLNDGYNCDLTTTLRYDHRIIRIPGTATPALGYVIPGTSIKGRAVRNVVGHPHFPGLRIYNPEFTRAADHHLIRAFFPFMRHRTDIFQRNNTVKFGQDLRFGSNV